LRGESRGGDGSDEIKNEGIRFRETTSSSSARPIRRRTVNIIFTPLDSPPFFLRPCFFFTTVALVASASRNEVGSIAKAKITHIYINPSFLSFFFLHALFVDKRAAERDIGAKPMRNAFFYEPPFRVRDVPILSPRQLGEFASNEQSLNTEAIIAVQCLNVEENRASTRALTVRINTRVWKMDDT